MSNEWIGFLVSIIGGLLSLNAWYFKDVVKQLKAIELQLVRLVTQHDIMSDVVNKHDKELDTLRNQVFENKSQINLLSGEIKHCKCYEQ